MAKSTTLCFQLTLYLQSQRQSVYSSVAAPPMSSILHLSILILDGKDLPRVEHADHLGHTLHEPVTMNKDCTSERARFIDRSVEV